MKIGEVDEARLRRLLRDPGLTFRVPGFVTRLWSDIPRVASDVQRMYAAFDLGADEEFADFHLRVGFDGLWRRWVKPRARFSADGQSAFSALPAAQAFHMVEWGLNWAVTSSAHRYLIYHAAVLERQGRAVMLPAPPGSGKSTLTAALAQRGWRLLSDELALLDPRTGLVHGMARPVNLKNTAIDLIRRFAPDAVLTEPVPDTLKGTLALMRAPEDSIARAREPARPAWVITPRYLADSSAQLLPVAKARMLMVLADQAFNYDIHGRAGFETTANLVDRCDCFEFVYSSLDEAVETFDGLAGASPR
jgi:HprK-related kinase A